MLRPKVIPLGMEQLESRDVPAVVYYGGALLTHVEAQAVYLGNEWSNPTVTGQPSTSTIDNSISKLVQASVTDSSSGAYLQALTRAGYGVGTGTASAGVIDSTNYASGSTITDASIQARLNADIASGLVQPPDANRLYIVYVEPNVAVNLGAGQGTTQQGILGYHGTFAGANGQTIHYAVVAYPGGTAGNSSLGVSALDQLTAVTSHEVAEAVTDPNVNFGQLGWYDSRRGEIGDITENTPGSLVRWDGYLVQLASDKNDQLLPIQAPTSPPVSPPPPASPPPVVSPPPAPTPQRQPTTTTISARQVGNIYGIPEAEITVTVSAGSIPASGTVSLVVNGRVLGSAQLTIVNGVATAKFYVYFYSPGVFWMSVNYGGTTTLAPSTSNTILATV